MNTRIQQLITQAGTDTSGKWMSLDHAEVFAELILQTCADRAYQLACQELEFSQSHNAIPLHLYDAIMDIFKDAA